MMLKSDKFRRVLKLTIKAILLFALGIFVRSCFVSKFVNRIINTSDIIKCIESYYDKNDPIENNIKSYRITTNRINDDQTEYYVEAYYYIQDENSVGDKFVIVDTKGSLSLTKNK